MTLKQFAELYRLRLRHDECGDSYVPGKNGQIDEYSDAKLGVMYMPSVQTRQGWAFARRALQAAGCSIAQNGDREGAAIFDPQDCVQSRLAIRIAGVKRRRQLSPRDRVTKLRILSRINADRNPHKNGARHVPKGRLDRQKGERPASEPRGPTAVSGSRLAVADAGDGENHER